jgi:hypothetical protein
MGRLTPEAVAAWVAASCERQGVPVKITDARVIGHVASLLSDGRARPGRQAERRRAAPPPDSQPPDRLDSSRIEGVASGRRDHRVVEHSADDGVLSGEVEIRPLSA